MWPPKLDLPHNKFKIKAQLHSFKANKRKCNTTYLNIAYLSHCSGHQNYQNQSQYFFYAQAAEMMIMKKKRKKWSFTDTREYCNHQKLQTSFDLLHPIADVLSPISAKLLTPLDLWGAVKLPPAKQELTLRSSSTFFSLLRCKRTEDCWFQGYWKICVPSKGYIPPLNGGLSKQWYYCI